jgi:hypothetical protein
MKKEVLVISLFASLVFAAACSKSPSTASRNSGSPQRLSTNASSASEPAVATGMDGTLYVVWVEHRGKDADVMLKRLNNAGESLSDPIRINPQPGQATAWRGDQPTIAIAPDNTAVYVGWTGRAEAGSGISPDIYLSASRDGGKSFAPPVKVNDDQKPNDHGMHSLAVAPDGRIYVAWLDERNVAPEPAADMKMKAGSSGHHMESNREVFFSSSQDGGRSFSPNRSIAKDVCPCCKTNLAVVKDGRVYVSWRQVLPGDFRHIAVSSSSDQGNTFAKATIVSNDEWVLKGCPVSGAALSADADGTLRVLWYAGGDKGERGIYSSESRDRGQTFSPRQLLAAGAAHGTPVLLPARSDRDHATTGVWQDGEGSQAQILTARFAAAITPKRLGTGELPAVAVTNDQVFIVYVAGESGKQAIWLISAERGKFESDT